MNYHGIVSGYPLGKRLHPSEPGCRIVFGRQESILITLEQVDIPLNRHAKFGVHNLAVSIIREVQDIHI